LHPPLHETEGHMLDFSPTSRKALIFFSSGVVEYPPTWWVPCPTTVPPAAPCIPIP
jgi:hypothetical protein